MKYKNGRERNHLGKINEKIKKGSSAANEWCNASKLHRLPCDVVLTQCVLWSV